MFKMAILKIVLIGVFVSGIAYFVFDTLTKIEIAFQY
jgi:hypothetical protein